MRFSDKRLRKFAKHIHADSSSAVRFVFLRQRTVATLGTNPGLAQEGTAMSSALPRALLALQYEKYAQEYQKNLRLDEIMEGTDQATQREITLESLALVKAERADFHVFNELLLQYARKGKKRPG